MATPTDTLFNMMSPQKARLLDQQMQQQRMQGTNYGGGAMGNFLTAASGAQRAITEGAGQLATRAFAGGERQMGQNEKAAVEANQAAQAKKQQMLQALQNKTPEQLKTIQRNALAAGNTTLADLAGQIQALDKPVVSMVDAAEMAKDHTGESVAAYIKTGNPAVLVTRDGSKSNYVRVDVATGTDRNGQPIMRTVLVDKNQVARITNNSAVVDVSDLQGNSLLNVTPTEEPQQNVSKEEEEAVAELNGIKGLTVKQNLELREEVEMKAGAMLLLGKRISDPRAESVLGLSKAPNRFYQETAETELGTLSSYLGRFSIKEAIAAAKMLGVNPTDKDFEKSMAAKPQVSDGVKVWKDWYVNEYLADFKTFVNSQYEGTDERKKQVLHTLDAMANEVVNPKEVEKTTSSGVKYTVISGG